MLHMYLFTNKNNSKSQILVVTYSSRFLEGTDYIFISLAFL